MSKNKLLNLDMGKLQDGLEDYYDASAEAANAAVEARLTEFDRHKDDLLGHLQKVCDRQPQTKSFDRDECWRRLRSIAAGRFWREANVEKNRVPAATRVKMLRQLGDALSAARCQLDEAWHHQIRGVLFVEWCEAHGNPDFTDPIIDRYSMDFDKLVGGMVAGLADLETAASRAAEYAAAVGGKPGPPGGASPLQHEFIIDLEHAYRDITGKPGRVGGGPFSQFIEKFLEAMACKSTRGTPLKKATIDRAIKAAKEREERDPATSRWGRERPPLWDKQLFRRLRGVGKIRPNSR